jgi:hypothetical protein
MQPTRFSPCPELRELLLRAYEPCIHFDGACKRVATWKPERGHVPRGFLGALGSLDEVALVLVAAEPGDPLFGETYGGPDPADFLERCVEEAYRDFDQMANPFHREIRRILDECFPNLDFSQQMRRTWITDAYLCSARVEGGHVPAVSWRTCARDYLLPQLRLLKDRAIVALGGKAKDRMADTGEFDGRFLHVHHPSARDRSRARETWREIPPYLHEKRPRARPG